MADGERSRDRSRDALAVITGLADVADPGQVAAGFRDAMRSAYWDQHDLAGAMAVAYAGIGRLLAAAARAAPAEADEIRADAKALTYDLASFTWPGWDEPGVEISDSQAAAGLAAARANLGMAVDLGKGDLATARAHWMLGAHLLTAGEYPGAVVEFEHAEQYARRAGSDAEADLAVAFCMLGELAAGDDAAESRLEVALERLGGAAGGEGFVTQVETARRLLDL